ncbi:MAG: MarR family transcriptional regulator [Thermoplasmata archaeon]|nr:MarR family transcriptional regulator [Thermoplasmata archaeon]
MVESEEVARDIREIRWHQEAIDSSMELLIKANRDAILSEIMAFFGKSRRRAQVFLAVDGQRTVEDITQMLAMKKPNVSAQLTGLKEEGLIEIKRITKSGYVYKKRRVDKILGISKKLKNKFGTET